MNAKSLHCSLPFSIDGQTVFQVSVFRQTELDQTHPKTSSFFHLQSGKDTGPWQGKLHIGKII
jgi:hypothetical protein